MFHFGINKSEWLQIEQRYISNLLGAQIFFDQYSNFSWHLNGLRFRNLILFYKNQTVTTYAPRADFEFILQSLKPRFQTLDKELLDGIKGISDQSYQKLSVLWRQVRRAKLTDYPDDKLASLFLDYYQITLNEIFLVNFLPLELTAIAALTDMVNEKSSDPAQAHRDIATLCMMEKPSLATKEEIALCQIAAMTIDPGKIRRALTRTKDRARLVERNYPDLYELFVEHVEKYRFLIGGYSELSWDIEDFLRRYTDILEMGPEWAEQRIEHLSSYARECGLKKRKVLSRLKDDGALQKLSRIVNDLTSQNETNRIAFNQALEVREILTQEITERIGVGKDELQFYVLDELIRLIRNRERLDKKEIVRRSRGVVFNSGIYLYSGSDATRFIDRHIPARLRRAVLTGQCANPGLYEGVVRIVRSLGDVEKVRFGDVVVSESSGTVFAEALRKAGGVILEAGTLISPAAQFCRETDVPCLINVESALESLHDGDVIIMDSLNENICHAAKGNEPAQVADACTIKVFHYDPSEPMILRLEEVAQNQAELFGLKTVTLAMLMRDGFQIPGGFAVGRSAMYNYLAGKGCEIVNGVYETKTVEKARSILAEENSTEYLRNLPLDATVIFDEDGCVVRGSWLPGDLMNQVEMPSCSTPAIRTIEGLWKAIRKCWQAFLEQPLAVTENGGEALGVGGGILIQQYKPGDRSGVIQSLDLEHPGSNVMTLEACLGTGASLRSGKARIDRYRISRKTERIINRIIPLKTRFEMVQPKTGKTILIPVPEDLIEAEVLNRQQIRTLVSGVLRIEKLMESPVQVEFTVKGGEIYLLDAKPLAR